MSNAISGLSQGQPIPRQQVPVKLETKAAIPKSAQDTVTISPQGKQAVALRTDGSTPQEEAKESPIEKAVEATAGKK